MRLLLVTAMRAAVAPMHEQVKERASKQQEPGQRTEQMGSVLVPKQENC